ncbi:MAG: heme ABC transporter permease [Gammaproteobacteria bacterium]|jgi:heme exporter protein C|nr:heme ABC transporter permease [Gammaproteobacteria bacterium]
MSWFDNWHLPKWFYQMASPKWFFDFGARLQPWFAALALLFIVCGLVWGLLYAPADYQQGNSFRIMYVHVPAAILSQSIFLMMGVTGAIGLIWKMKVAFMVARACTLVGASFTALALITGAIWGKPTWGAYWVWDARLTSTLIMLFLYTGVMALNQAIADRSVAGRATAILAIIGSINIPVIKYSVEWWNTLHQASTFTLTAKPSMPPEMYMPLLFMVLGCYCLCAWLVVQGTRNEILDQERQASWVARYLEDQ